MLLLPPRSTRPNTLLPYTTLFPSPLDLLETAFSEILLIAAPHHAADHLVAEIVDRPDVAERRHRAAQAVGFLGGEIGSDHRQLQRLFLELRNAQGVLQDVVQLILTVTSEESRGGNGGDGSWRP